MIIDSDKDMAVAFKQAVQIEGAEVNQFITSDEALLNLDDYDGISLIILSTTCSQINAFKIFETIRNLQGLQYVPILISSNTHSDSDFKASGEMPCLGYVEKPYNTGQIRKMLNTLGEEGSWFKAKEEKLRSLLSPNDRPDRAVVAYYQLLETAPRPQPLIMAFSRVLAHNGDMKKAKDILDDGLDKYGQSAIITFELARLEYLSGNFARSKDLIEASKKFIPNSIGRLLLAGEIDLNLGEPESALMNFEQVLALDPSNIKADTGKTISEGINASPGFKESLFKAKDPNNLVAILNLMGITYAREGNFSEALDMYQKAIKITDEKTEFQKVMFNIALCYMRSEKFAESITFLIECTKFEGELKVKSEKFLSKIQNSLARVAKEAHAETAKSASTDEIPSVDELDIEDINFDKISKDPNYKDLAHATKEKSKRLA